MGQFRGAPPVFSGGTFHTSAYIYIYLYTHIHTLDLPFHALRRDQCIHIPLYLALFSYLRLFCISAWRSFPVLAHECMRRVPPILLHQRPGAALAFRLSPRGASQFPGHVRAHASFICFTSIFGGYENLPLKSLARGYVSLPF